MYSELFTSGCSMLTGAYDHDEYEYLPRPEFRKRHRSAFQNPKQRSFPKLLSEALNIPLINKAKAGENNSYIIRTAYNYIKNKRGSNKRSLVILGLTDFARRAIHYPYKDDYHFISPHDNYTHVQAYKENLLKYISPSKFNKLQDDIYKYSWNENLALSELMQDLNMLHSFGKYSNCKVIVFQSFHRSKLCNLSEIFTPTKEKYKNEFDFFNFGFPKDKLYSWSDFIRLYAPEHKSGHPLSYDTLVFSKYMAEYIRTESISQLTLNVSEYDVNFTKTVI